VGETVAWKAEQRYRAVLEVRDGSPVSAVATRHGVSRQTIHAWRNRHAQDGVAGLREVVGVTDQERHLGPLPFGAGIQVTNSGPHAVSTVMS